MEGNMWTYAPVLSRIHRGEFLKLKRIQVPPLEPPQPIRRVQPAQVLAHDTPLADLNLREDAIRPTPQGSGARISRPLDAQLSRLDHPLHAAPEQPHAAVSEASRALPPADEAGIPVVYPVGQDGGAGLGAERRAGGRTAAALAPAGAVRGLPVRRV